MSFDGFMYPNPDLTAGSKSPRYPLESSAIDYYSSSPGDLTIHVESKIFTGSQIEILELIWAFANLSSSLSSTYRQYLIRNFVLALK